MDINILNSFLFHPRMASQQIGANDHLIEVLPPMFYFFTEMEKLVRSMMTLLQYIIKGDSTLSLRTFGDMVSQMVPPLLKTQ